MITAKLIWFLILIFYGYLIGTNPWNKIQACRIWNQFLRFSVGPWSMVKRVYRHIDSNLIGRIFLATLGLLLFILFVFWITHIKFELFKKASLEIIDWSDLRTLGWAFSGVVATWLAIVGAILSAARTKAMEEGNKATAEANQETKHKRLHERYENALKAIDGEGLSAIGAIETIKTVALQDESLLDETMRILCSYLNYNAKIDDRENRTCSRHNQFYLHFQHALLALVELQRQRLRTADLVPNNRVVLLFLDLRAVHISDQATITGFNFGGCNFNEAVFERSKFVGVEFIECDMTSTRLREVEFKKAEKPHEESKLKRSEFDGANVSNTNFLGIQSLGHRQMLRVEYHHQFPPKNFPYKLTDEQTTSHSRSLATHPILPTPWDTEKGQPWEMERWEKYKASEGAVVPLDQQGNEVPIVEPETLDAEGAPYHDSDQI